MPFRTFARRASKAPHQKIRCRFIEVRSRDVESTICAAPDQDGAVHSRNAHPINLRKWACLSHAHGHARTHPESTQRLCAVKVRGSNPPGSTSEASANGETEASGCRDGGIVQQPYSMAAAPYLEGGGSIRGAIWKPLDRATVEALVEGKV